MTVIKRKLLRRNPIENRAISASLVETKILSILGPGCMGQAGVSLLNEIKIIKTDTIRNPRKHSDVFSKAMNVLDLPQESTNWY